MPTTDKKIAPLSHNYMEKAACIDIGTNSVLLAIASPDRNGWIREVDYDQKITQLGQESQIGNTLKPLPMDRTRKAIREMVTRARNQEINAIFLVGTQALREAKNADYFTDLLRHDTGLSIKVLTGEEEAHLSFIAADRSLPHSPAKIVVDSGGGSTELAQGADGHISRFISIPVGCVKLSDQFMIPAEMDEMRKFVRKFLAEQLHSWESKHFELVMMGGTATSLAAIDLGLKQYDAARVHGHRLSQDWVAAFAQKFAFMAPEEKLSLSCASPERLNVLAAGMEILLALMRHFRTPNAVISDAGLRHAVLWQYFFGASRL